MGGFLILNTFTITLTQRTRELALLRAIGASRRQVFASQVTEAGIIGLVSGAIGAVAGIALAEALRWLFRVAGAALPPGPLVVSPAGLLRITLLGAAVTIVAALYPCWRATTVAPVVAITDDAVRSTRHPVARVVLGAIATVVGAVVVAAAILGDSDNRLALLGIGAVVGFVGVAALSVVLVRPLARVVGREPLRRRPRRRRRSAPPPPAWPPPSGRSSISRRRPSSSSPAWPWPLAPAPASAWPGGSASATPPAHPGGRRPPPPPSWWAWAW